MPFRSLDGGVKSSKTSGLSATVGESIGVKWDFSESPWVKIYWGSRRELSGQPLLRLQQSIILVTKTEEIVDRERKYSLTRQRERIPDFNCHTLRTLAILLFNDSLLVKIHLYRFFVSLLYIILSNSIITPFLWLNDERYVCRNIFLMINSFLRRWKPRKDLQQNVLKVQFVETLAIGF